MDRSAKLELQVKRYVGRHQNVLQDENFVNVAQGFVNIIE